ncbi:hypothetical protein RIF29_40650 [Crotalaria pallida]|uniref:Uncharacterized protein n=1 Tax=Crotalaria pallida TaxID=3830 RepID=A0AAN9E8Y3_CROPI
MDATSNGGKHWWKIGQVEENLKAAKREALHYEGEILARLGQSLSMRFPKSQLWKKCSRHFVEQKTRFYIIWRCTVILIRCKER